MEYFRKLPFSRKSPFVFRGDDGVPVIWRLPDLRPDAARCVPAAISIRYGEIPVEPVSSLEPVAGEEHSTGKGRPAFGSQ